MLRLSFLLVLLLAGLFSIFALASESRCLPFIKKEGAEPKKCKCGSAVSAYPYSGVKTLPLVAVCGYTKESWGFTGGFYFDGDTVLHGKIRREETETFGDWSTFLVNKSSMRSLPTVDRTLRFGHEVLARNKLRIPSITAKTPCWTANASIHLKKLYVLEGPGTDADGSYIIDFEISEVGHFKKCMPYE